METISDFCLQTKPDGHLISKYSSLLPEKLLHVWQESGFGTAVDGYLKIVNPDDFNDLLNELYTPVYANPVVMFATAMADLVIWENNYTILLNCRYGISKIIESGFKYFLEDVYDEDFIADELKGGNYLKAKNQYGDIAFDECFGYVPLLVFGGAEKVEHLKKVKLKEHLSIISQAAGKIV